MLWSCDRFEFDKVYNLLIWLNIMENQEYKKVLTFGSFDLIHPGHHYFLNKAKELGDELIVVLSRDGEIMNYKGNFMYEAQERIKQLMEIDCVDRTILDFYDKFQVLDVTRPDVIALGYDQGDCFKDKLEREVSERGLGTEIVRLDSYKPEIYKSSLLKEARRR